MAGSRVWMGTLSVPTFDFPLLCYTTVTIELTMGSQRCQFQSSKSQFYWNQESSVYIGLKTPILKLTLLDWSRVTEPQALRQFLKKSQPLDISVAEKVSSNPWDLGIYVKNITCRSSASIYETLLECTMNWPWVFLRGQRSLLLWSWIGLNHAMRSNLQLSLHLYDNVFFYHIFLRAYLGCKKTSIYQAFILMQNSRRQVLLFY